MPLQVGHTVGSVTASRRGAHQRSMAERGHASVAFTIPTARLGVVGLTVGSCLTLVDL